MHGMGKGAQALRVALGWGRKMTSGHPGSGESGVRGVGGTLGRTLAQKLPLLAFQAACAL